MCLDTEPVRQKCEEQRNWEGQLVRLLVFCWFFLHCLRVFFVFCLALLLILYKFPRAFLGFPRVGGRGKEGGRNFHGFNEVPSELTVTGASSDP